MQDIQCLVRELSCNPDEKRKFYKLLEISDYATRDVDGVPINSASDVTDGASILRHPMEKELKDVTYQGLAAVLYHPSLNRRDLALKYCTTQSESDIHLAVCASYNFGSFYDLIYKFDCLPVSIHTNYCSRQNPQDKRLQSDKGARMIFLIFLAILSELRG